MSTALISTDLASRPALSPKLDEIVASLLSQYTLDDEPEMSIIEANPLAQFGQAPLFIERPVLPTDF